MTKKHQPALGSHNPFATKKSAAFGSNNPFATKKSAAFGSNNPFATKKSAAFGSNNPFATKKSQPPQNSTSSDFPGTRAFPRETQSVPPFPHGATFPIGPSQSGWPQKLFYQRTGPNDGPLGHKTRIIPPLPWPAPRNLTRHQSPGHQSSGTANTLNRFTESGGQEDARLGTGRVEQTTPEHMGIHHHKNKKHTSSTALLANGANVHHSSTGHGNAPGAPQGTQPAAEGALTNFIHHLLPLNKIKDLWPPGGPRPRDEVADLFKIALKSGKATDLFYYRVRHLEDGSDKVVDCVPIVEEWVAVHRTKEGSQFFIIDQDLSRKQNIFKYRYLDSPQAVRSLQAFDSKFKFVLPEYQPSTYTLVPRPEEVPDRPVRDLPIMIGGQFRSNHSSDLYDLSTYGRNLSNTTWNPEASSHGHHPPQRKQTGPSPLGRPSVVQDGHPGSSAAPQPVPPAPRAINPDLRQLPPWLASILTESDRKMYPNYMEFIDGNNVFSGCLVDKNGKKKIWVQTSLADTHSAGIHWHKGESCFVIPLGEASYWYILDNDVVSRLNQRATVKHFPVVAPGHQSGHAGPAASNWYDSPTDGHPAGHGTQNQGFLGGQNYGASFSPQPGPAAPGHPSGYCPPPPVSNWNAPTTDGYPPGHRPHDQGALGGPKNVPVIPPRPESVGDSNPRSRSTDFHNKPLSPMANGMTGGRPALPPGGHRTDDRGPASTVGPANWNKLEVTVAPNGEIRMSSSTEPALSHHSSGHMRSEAPKQIRPEQYYRARTGDSYDSAASPAHGRKAFVEDEDSYDDRWKDRDRGGTRYRQSSPFNFATPPSDTSWKWGQQARPFRPDKEQVYAFPYPEYRDRPHPVAHNNERETMWVGGQLPDLEITNHMSQSRQLEGSRYANRVHMRKRHYQANSTPAKFYRDLKKDRRLHKRGWDRSVGGWWKKRKYKTAWKAFYRTYTLQQARGWALTNPQGGATELDKAYKYLARKQLAVQNIYYRRKIYRDAKVDKKLAKKARKVYDKGSEDIDTEVGDLEKLVKEQSLNDDKEKRVDSDDSSRGREAEE